MLPIYLDIPDSASREPTSSPDTEGTALSPNREIWYDRVPEIAA